MNTLFYWGLFYGCVGVIAHFRGDAIIFIVTWLTWGLICFVGATIVRELKNETKNGK